MKTIVKKGIEKLPLVYQLADVKNITSLKEGTAPKEIRPNRFIKITKYNTEKTVAFKSAKPISKII